MEGKEKTIVYALVAACVLGIIFIGAFVFAIDTSESFSELYFDDHEELPRVVDIGEEIKFAFTVASHEKSRAEYNYTVKFGDNVSDEGRFYLDPGDNQTVKVTIVPENSRAVHFDVNSIASLEIPIDGAEKLQQMLPQTGQSLSSLTMNLNEGLPKSWSVTKLTRVGSPENTTSSGLGSISTLGYLISVEKYSILADGGSRILRYNLTENEYRYLFNNASVNVTSTRGVSGMDIEKKNYEIHFWVVVRENLYEILDQ